MGLLLLFLSIFLILRTDNLSKTAPYEYDSMWNIQIPMRMYQKSIKAYQSVTDGAILFPDGVTTGPAVIFPYFLGFKILGYHLVVPMMLTTISFLTFLATTIFLYAKLFQNNNMALVTSFILFIGTAMALYQYDFGIIERLLGESWALMYLSAGVALFTVGMVQSTVAKQTVFLFLAGVTFYLAIYSKSVFLLPVVVSLILCTLFLLILKRKLTPVLALGIGFVTSFFVWILYKSLVFASVKAALLHEQDAWKHIFTRSSTDNTCGIPTLLHNLPALPHYNDIPPLAYWLMLVLLLLFAYKGAVLLKRKKRAVYLPLTILALSGSAGLAWWLGCDTKALMRHAYPFVLLFLAGSIPLAAVIFSKTNSERRVLMIGALLYLFVVAKAPIWQFPGSSISPERIEQNAISQILRESCLDDCTIYMDTWHRYPYIPFTTRKPNYVLNGNETAGDFLIYSKEHINCPNIIYQGQNVNLCRL